jgi:ATP-independent RNA helicase DbpA
MINTILANLKIEALNEMQLATLKASKENKDLVLLSPTGSGKTLGFLLPILNSLDKSKKGIQALVIVPSRELAIQIEQVFKQMGTGYKVSCFYGGHSTRTEKNNLEEPAALVVGTPGRLADHIRRETLDGSDIQTLVLDEFDKALEFGFEKDMTFIIENIGNVKKRILTSATNIDEIPSFTGVRNPIILNFVKDQVSSQLTLKYIKSTGTDKLDALFNLICKIGDKTTLIFCNHREAVERISEVLAEKGIGHDVFHGGLEQDERQRALIKFRNGSHRILITTDLASRGLDIPEIENVIHYQLPPHENAFIHRNGRTARMHAEGTSYLVLGETEPIPDYVQQSPDWEELGSKIAVPKNSPWETLYISAGKKDKINKMDIVGFLHQKMNLQKDEVGLIEVQDHASYVAIKRDKIEMVVQNSRNEKIKKQSVKIQIAR